MSAHLLRVFNSRSKKVRVVTVDGPCRADVRAVLCCAMLCYAVLQYVPAPLCGVKGLTPIAFMIGVAGHQREWHQRLVPYLRTCDVASFRFRVVSTASTMPTRVPCSFL